MNDALISYNAPACTTYVRVTGESRDKDFYHYRSFPIDVCVLKMKKITENTLVYLQSQMKNGWRATCSVFLFSIRAYPKMNGRAHKERAQPSNRLQRFGLLEKKKDYKLRADDYHRKERRIKALQARARNKNQDEFAFGMMNKKLRNRVGKRNSIKYNKKAH